MIYHNIKHKIFYYPIYRCGSSLLRDISSRYDDLVEYHDDEGFKLLDLNRECPIYIIYRDPETRFKSGLQITVQRFLPYKQEFMSDVGQLLEKGYDVHFESAIAFLDNVVTTDIRTVAGFWNGKLMRPYHLYDSHLDHMLWRILILKAYGYNVVPLPINEYDRHLGPLYPKAYMEILKSHDRPETFKNNNKRSLELWDIYKKVYIQDSHFYNKSQRPVITFKEWMDEEKKIFTMIESFGSQKNFQFACLKMIKKLFEGKTYFQDMYSPSVDRIHEMLNIVHNYKKPIKEFEAFHDMYEKIKNNIHALQSGEYLRRKQ